METPDDRRMECDEARAALLLASDGELSVLRGRLLDAHLASCSGCQRYCVRLGQVEQRLCECRDALDSVQTLRSVRGSAPAKSVAVASAAAAVLLLVVWASWTRHFDTSSGQVVRDSAFTNGGEPDGGDVVALSLPLSP